MWNFWPKYWKKQKVVRNWNPLGWIDYSDGVLQKCGHFYPTVNICWFTGKRKLKMQALKLSFQTSKSHLWVKIFRNVFFQKFRLDILNPVEKILKGVFTEIFDILRFLTSEVTFRIFFICGKIEIPFFLSCWVNGRYPELFEQNLYAPILIHPKTFGYTTISYWGILI